jgi:hypothetical protein
MAALAQESLWNSPTQLLGKPLFYLVHSYLNLNIRRV